jgi:DNA repair protein radc
MQNALRKLGIIPNQNLSIDIILGEHFNGAIYGLDSGQMERVQALREVVATYEESHTEKVTKVTCSKDALKVFRHAMRHLSHEEVMVIFLNNMNAVLHVESLYRGSTGEVAFGTRDILSRALSVNATAVIVAHNHPSGDPTPSACDIRQTEKLKKACDALEVSLLDHLIISKDRYYSFADETVSEYHNQ